MSMDDKDKFLMYLKIKEIPEDIQDFYLNAALEIINEIKEV